MRVEFLGVVNGGAAMVRVHVNHPLFPALFLTIEEANDHLARLMDALTDARKIRAATQSAVARAGSARPCDTEQPA